MLAGRNDPPAFMWRYWALPSIASENAVKHAIAIFIGFERYGTRSIAEDDAGGTVAVIDNRTHFVGPADHFCSGRFQSVRRLR